MRLRALAAFAALAGALSLAACNGGTTSTGIANVTGQQALIRFVNAGTALGTIDVYYTSNGTSISSTPTIRSLAYGSITSFAAQPTTSATIVLRPANNATATLPVACTTQSLSNNGLYTIAFTGNGSNVPYSCLFYHDIGYTGNGQVRLHHASYTAASAGLSTLALGTVATGSGPGASAQQVSNATGALPASGGSVDVPGFQVPTTGALTFAVGPVAPTFNATTTYSATLLPVPGSSTAANTAGTLPGAGYNNASLFAIDCTGATTPQGSPCANGVGLIGTFDSN